MYDMIKSAHHLVAVLMVLILFFAVVYAFYGWKKQVAFSKSSKIILVLGLVMSHVQMIIGVLIYLISPWGIENFDIGIFNDNLSRFYGLEHPMMMLLGIILVTIGYSKTKSISSDQAKFKMAALYYLSGLVFILARIPWRIFLS